MKPRVSILNKAFRYRNSASTDVRKTWEAAKKRNEADAKTVKNIQDYLKRTA